MPATNATQRFSSRVEKYVRYRPGYPAAIIELLSKECGLEPGWTIADIASGTGIFTRLLLENGNKVLGVEPNADMRHAGEEYLKQYPNFSSIAGTAETTGLPNQSVDLVTAAQAAHWFDRLKARQEFARILKPGGWVALIWNERLTGGSPFLRDYEKLLATYGTDYQEVRHERTTDEITEFFSPAPFQSRELPNRQEFDYGGLEGRLLSSSYTPQKGDPKYEPMLQELRRIFDTHNKDGKVAIEYSTRVFHGQIT